MAQPVSSRSHERKHSPQAESADRAQAQHYPALGPQANILDLQRTAGNRAVSQMLQTDTDRPAHADNSVPPIVEDVLNSGGGQPLDPGTRASMGSTFGYDFSEVRVHTNGKAIESAKSISAKAYTSGYNVVFGEGYYKPGTAAGDHLLAHELAHVVQQRNAGYVATPPLGPNASSMEDEAGTAASHVLSGQTAGPLSEAGTQSVQRAPELSTASIGQSVETQAADIIEAKLIGFLFPFFPGPLAKAAFLGFIHEIRTELVEQKKFDSFMKQLAELVFHPTHMLELGGGEALGLAAGVVSPVTGIFDLFVFVETLSNLSAELNRRGGLAYLALEVGALAQDFIDYQNQARDKLVKWVTSDPVGAITTITEIANLGPLGIVGKLALMAAEEAGRGVGRALIGAFEEPWEKKSGEPEKSNKPGLVEELMTRPLGFASSQIERFKDQLLATPWMRIGYQVGWVVGFAIISIVLFVASDGIGNIISYLGQALGKLAPALAGAGKFVETFGAAIAAIEKGIALIMGALLKPFEEILKPFVQLLERLQSFLKRLLGVAEKTETAAVGAAGKAMANLESELPKGTAPAMHEPAAAPIMKQPAEPPLVAGQPSATPVSAPMTEAPPELPPTAPAKAPMVEMQPEPDSPTTPVAKKLPEPASATTPLAEKPPEPASPTTPAAEKPSKPASATTPLAEKPPEPVSPTTPAAEKPSKPAPSKGIEPQEGDAKKSTSSKPGAAPIDVDKLQQQRLENQTRINELNKEIEKYDALRKKRYKEADEILAGPKTPENQGKYEQKLKRAKRETPEETQAWSERKRLQDENERIRQQIERTRIGPKPGEPHGGSWKDVPTAGGEVNHIPADSVSPLPHDKGPAIWMEQQDHYQTNSWGSSDVAVEWRAKQKALIDQGKFRDAVQMDIDDIRQKFGNKYDQGIQEMLDYLDTLNPKDLRPK